jgi:hypothetical protein
VEGKNSRHRAGGREMSVGMRGGRFSAPIGISKRSSSILVGPAGKHHIVVM